MECFLDNDLYKFTMQQAVCQKFPRAHVRYDFINRGDIPVAPGVGERLHDVIRHIWNEFALTDEEASFLEMKCPFLTPMYLDFLRGYRFDPNEVTILTEGGELNVRIEGPWYRTILWEVPLMAAISELHFEQEGPIQWELLNKTNCAKIDLIHRTGIRVADFGTRRRYSFEVQDQTVNYLVSRNALIGTSNVHLALKYGVKPIGTVAHEWDQFHAVRYGYKSANRMALKNWQDMYGGDLGITLADTYTTEVFLRAFDMRYAKLFDGVRQDSGDPLEFTDKVLVHYRSLGIDPMSKTIVFSDSLTVEKAAEIAEYCEGKIKCAFGIGTSLTNDVGVEPLNMVIKLTGVRQARQWTSAVKLSDGESKNTGDKAEIELCKKILFTSNTGEM